jgi:hypothetical protein
MTDSNRASEIEAIAERLESAAPAGTLDDDDLLIAMSEETHAILSEERDKHETWRGLLEWMDRRWPEDLFPTLTDSPGRDTGPRLTSALRRLAAVEKLAREMAAKAPAEDWGDDVMSTAHADAGRAFLRIIGSES